MTVLHSTTTSTTTTFEYDAQGRVVKETVETVETVDRPGPPQQRADYETRLGERS